MKESQKALIILFALIILLYLANLLFGTVGYLVAFIVAVLCIFVIPGILTFGKHKKQLHESLKKEIKKEKKLKAEGKIPSPLIKLVLILITIGILLPMAGTGNPAIPFLMLIIIYFIGRWHY